MSNKFYRFTLLSLTVACAVTLSFVSKAVAQDSEPAQPEQETPFQVDPEEFKKAKELEPLDKGPHINRFQWWPTPAQPGPVPDDNPKKHGMWWWPDVDQALIHGGNKGYVYVWKIIPGNLETGESAFVIKEIRQNVKIYFDYDKYDLRDDAMPVLKDAVSILEKHKESSILITGNADVRGTEQYNQVLGESRANTVKEYMLASGVAADRIKIISRGKLDAVAPVSDFEGMQKDRNAQFMVADVIEIPVPKEEMERYKNEKQILETKDVETATKVDFEEYTVQKNDTLWSIANTLYGAPHRWKNIYNANRDAISDPNNLKPGTVIKIPRE